jgi:preprotein translocase subunit SecY
MKLPKLLATVMAALIAALGVVGVAFPSLLLEFGRSLHAPGALLVAAAIRIVFGAVLVWVASASRMPRTLRVIGILVIIGGILTPVFGVERFQEILDWFSSQGPLFMRAWAGVAVIFGLFVAYVVNAPRRTAA